MAEDQQVVEAEVIEQELAPIDAAIDVNLDGLAKRLADVNGAIAAANAAVAELTVDDKALEGMTYEDVKRFEQDLNRQFGEAEKARKAFNGDYDTPKKAVKLAYDAAIAPVQELHARYKARRVEIEEGIRQGHWNALEAAYLDFMAGNGLSELAEAVPLERFAENGWWCSVAKSFNEKAAEDKMIKRATEIVADWNRVKGATWNYPEQAKVTYLRTLSWSAAFDEDERMAEEAARMAAIAAEEAENAAYAQEPCPDFDPVPEIVAEAEQVVAEAEQPATYCICVDLTPSQYGGLIDWFRSLGIHGTPMRTAFLGHAHAAQMVKAVCNG